MCPRADAAAASAGTGNEVLRAPAAAASINTASTTGTAGRAGVAAATDRSVADCPVADRPVADRSVAERPAADRSSAPANALSPPPGSGSVRIRSNATARGAAAAMRSSTAACTVRDHGQRPICARLASSIATITISLDAGRPSRASVAS